MWPWPSPTPLPREIWNFLGPLRVLFSKVSFVFYSGLSLIPRQRADPHQNARMRGHRRIVWFSLQAPGPVAVGCTCASWGVQGRKTKRHRKGPAGLGSTFCWFSVPSPTSKYARCLPQDRQSTWWRGDSHPPCAVFLRPIPCTFHQ